MANFLSKSFPIIGAAIDVISNIAENVKTADRNRKFEKGKDDFKNAINDLFVECIDQLGYDNWYFENFAPAVNVLENQVNEDEKRIKQMEETKSKYMAWAKKVNDIDCSIL